MSNNRKRGHDLERQVARDLTPFFKFVKTSRASSRLLDDCGIDLSGVPFLIQCKAGYERNRPKFEDEYRNIKTNIKRNFPETSVIHGMPIILIHKLKAGSGKQRGEELTQVTLSYDFFLHLLNINQENFEQWPILSP